MNQTKRKIIRYSIAAALSLAAWGVAVYLLCRYEYFAEFAAIDNPVGMMPVVLLTVAAGAFTCFAFLPWRKQYRIAAVALAVVVVLSAALFPNALIGNWWITTGNASSAETQPDLSGYEPFQEGNVTAKLDGEASLKLTSDFPVMDGALALYPLYTAFAEAVYARETYEPESVLFTNTLKAYDGIIAGERDVVFVAGASARQLQKAKEEGAELVFTPIGKEAFVFLVGAENPIDGITIRQIRNIYSGKTAKWNTLGWAEGGDIIAFQRPEGSGSQTGLQNVMKGLPIVVPQRLPDRDLIGSNSLMQQISVRYRGVQPALGYSYRFFAKTMFPNPEAKLLTVNGVAPSMENIQSGAYPFTAEFYAVTRGTPQGNTKLLIDWILSPQGQEIVAKTGYAPI